MKGLLFTYALTYGGAYASLANPFYGLLIYVCFAIIKPESLWHWSVPAGNYSRIIAIALLAGWVMRGCGNWNLGKARAPLFALIGFWLWAVVSTIACPQPELGTLFLENMGKIVLPVVVGVTLIETTQQLRWLAWTITLSQGYVAYDLNVSYYDGYNRLQDVGFGGMDNNFYVVSLLTGVGLAFFLGIVERAWWKKLLALAFAALMAHAVFFSFSRGGMLGLCVVIAVAFLVMPKTPKLLALFVVSAVLASMMAGKEVRERFASAFLDKEDRDYSAQSRMDLSNICLLVIAQNPIVGIGPNHFTRNARSYGLTEGKSAHTMWLETAAELGVPGILCLIAFYGLTIKRLLSFLWDNRQTTHEDDFIKAIPQMVIASLIGFCVSAQLVSVIGLEIPYYVALLGLGALKVNSARENELAWDNLDYEQHWFGYDAVRPRMHTTPEGSS